MVLKAVLFDLDNTLVDFMRMKEACSEAAIYAMIFGGSTTVILTSLEINLPMDLDANIFGIITSFLAYIIASKISKK